jgi:hypothetical protein
MPESYFRLSARDKADALNAASAVSGRPPHLLEKDIWVVWSLAALFESQFGSHLVFKGGTALSKAYNVIRRFSEDVDLTYDIRALAPQLSDSVSPDCLTAVGQYRSGRSQNGTANNSLTQQQFDTTSATNSEVQQLNLLNAAQAQQLTEMQSQAAMHVCLASQMTVANMQQRNAAAQDLNTAAAVQQQRTVNNTSAANEGSTWTTYLP